MDDELIHDLSAAYALNALDTEGERFYERHLAHCLRCRQDVAAFSVAASALAYAAPPATVPPELRRRILAALRAELAGAVRRNRRTFAPIAAVAAAAALCAAVGLGLGAATSSRPRATEAQRALPLHGAKGTVVRSGNGEATMIVAGLRRAPAGKTYEIWVLRGDSAVPAGVFSAASATTVVHLTRRLPHGFRVGVTLEPVPGSSRLTHRPLVISSRA